MSTPIIYVYEGQPFTCDLSALLGITDVTPTVVVGNWTYVAPFGGPASYPLSVIPWLTLTSGHILGGTPTGAQVIFPANETSGGVPIAGNRSLQFLIPLYVNGNRVDVQTWPPLFTAGGLTAEAGVGQPFSFDVAAALQPYGTGQVPGYSAADTNISLVSAPTWLALSSTLVKFPTSGSRTPCVISGTPPNGLNGNSYNVVLRAQVTGQGAFAGQALFQLITLVVTCDAISWSDSTPFQVNAIVGYPMSWNVLDHTPIGSNPGITLNPNLPVPSASWLTLQQRVNGEAMYTVVKGTPPVGSQGTTVVVPLQVRDYKYNYGGGGGYIPAGPTITGNLNIVISAPTGDLWIGDPYQIDASVDVPVSFDFSQNVPAGAAVVIQGGPDWLTVSGSSVAGIPPAGAVNTAVVVHLQATSGLIVDTATLTINVSPTPLLLNSPYTKTVVEGVKFLYQIRSSDPAIEVTASNLPPWLNFDSATLTFSGTVPFGADPLSIIGLKAVLDDRNEETTFTLTVTIKEVLSVQIDARSRVVAFDGGPPVYNHSDTIAWQVDFTPPDQADQVTSVSYSIKLKGDYVTYGNLIESGQCSRIGSSNGFQFVAQTLAGRKIDRLMTMYDSTSALDHLDCEVEFVWCLNGQPASGKSDLTLNRNFGLQTDGSGAVIASSPSSSQPASGFYPVDATMAGEVIDGQVFGFSTLPANMLLVALEAELQSPDNASDVNVYAVISDGTILGDAYFVTVPAGQKSARADFSATSFAISRGTKVGVKAVYVKSNDPGGPAQELSVRSLYSQ